MELSLIPQNLESGLDYPNLQNLQYFNAASNSHLDISKIHQEWLVFILSRLNH